MTAFPPQSVEITVTDIPAAELETHTFLQQVVEHLAWRRIVIEDHWNVRFSESAAPEFYQALPTSHELRARTRTLRVVQPLVLA